MAIIISQDGKKAKYIKKSQFDKETDLQQYIYDNPESIPLYEIKDDIHLLIVAREFPTASGPIDAVGVDKDGEVYLVETKLYKNADKRLVVAQVLDYGASLSQSRLQDRDFISKLEEHARTRGIVLRQKLSDHYALDDDQVTELLDRVERNVNDGNFKFVVLMDQLHDRLRDLIIFLNENSRFTVYAVDLEYYKHDTLEIVIPKLFGAQVKKDVAVASAGGVRRQWTEEQVLEDAKQRLEQNEYDQFEKIYKFSKQYADQIKVGTGSYGTFSPIFRSVCTMSLFTLGTDKRLSFNFEWVGKVNEETRERFKEGLEQIGFIIPQNYRQSRPSVRFEEWGPRTGPFIDMVKRLIGRK